MLFHLTTHSTKKIWIVARLILYQKNKSIELRDDKTEVNNPIRKLTQRRSKKTQKLLNELQKLKSWSKYQSSQIDQYSFKTPNSVSEVEDIVVEQDEGEDQVFKLDDVNIPRSYEAK